MKQIVLATTNPWKVKDYFDIATQFPITFIPQSELKSKLKSDLIITEAKETGLTFIENALIKAHHASLHTDLPVMAEDSGLIVDALQGAPGLYSARYAGEKATQQQNIEKLLSELAKIPNASRKAKLYAVTVLLRYPNDPAPLIAEGIIHGEILSAPKGDHGFGYLPIFYLKEYGCTAGEIPLSEKNKISHRGQAARNILNRYLSEI